MCDDKRQRRQIVIREYVTLRRKGCKKIYLEKKHTGLSLASAYLSKGDHVSYNDCQIDRRKQIKHNIDKLRMYLISTYSTGTSLTLFSGMRQGGPCKSQIRDIFRNSEIRACVKKACGRKGQTE